MTRIKGSCVVVVWAAVSLFGCNAILGNEDRHIGQAGAGNGGGSATGGDDAGGSGASGGTGTGGNGGNGGSADNAGAGAAGADAGAAGAEPGAAGAAPTGCSPVCISPKPICESGTCVECAADTKTCNGNTPSLCVGGAWLSQTACSGQTPACSNGICAAGTVSGGIITVSDGVLAPAAGGVHLAEHGFEYNPTTCGMVVGKQVCVSGGIRP
ncbi:MAG: hypothetical protein ABI548_17045 [Polyangiaceae bacterium]